MRDQLDVVGDQCAASTGGDDLVAVERQHRHPAVAAGRHAVAAGAECLGRVFHQRHAVARTRGSDAGPVGHRPVQVDRHNCSGQAIDRRPAVEFGVEQVGVEVPCIRLAVDEARASAQVGDGECTGPECEVADQHLVVAPHAHRHQREVDGRSTAGERRYRADAGEIGQLGLEGGDVGPGGCNPARIEGGEQHLAFAIAHLGRR